MLHHIINVVAVGNQLPYFDRYVVAERPFGFFVRAYDCNGKDTCFCCFGKRRKPFCYLFNTVAGIPCSLREESEHPFCVFYVESCFYCRNFYLISSYCKCSAKIHKSSGKEFFKKFFFCHKSYGQVNSQRQQERVDKAREEGRGMPIIRDGVSIRTQHQEIIIRRSPQGTLFSFDEAWEKPLDSYGKTASKRRGTIGQTAKILTTESGTLMEGSNNRGAIAVTRITYPYEWGDTLRPGSIEERMATESMIKALRKEAKEYLPARLSWLASRYGFKYDKLAIKNNLTNWGSCSSKGNINLNLHLVRLPSALCDFVILHELCHLKHFNHGPAFHSLFSQTCATHFADLIGEGKEYPDGQSLEKAFARNLRKYYLW